MARKASHDRHGSHAGRGFRYQDAVAAWLCVRVWAGIDPPSLIIPEGRDDVERRFQDGSALVQIKSRREHLGDLPLSDARDFLKALWDRHDKTSPAATGLELVLERRPTDHAVGSDGLVAVDPKLGAMLPGGTRGAGLLAKTVVRHAPEPNEAAIAIIAARTGCTPLAAQICFSRIVALCGTLADENGLHTPADYRGISTSDTEAAVTGMLEAVDITQVEAAIASGVVEPVDFLTPIDDPDFYLGVDVQPGHVAAGLVVPRGDARDAVTAGLQTRGAALVAGPSGAGKSAIMWDTAHSLRHTVRWYRLLRADPRDIPAVRRLLRALRADPGSPVGIVVDDVGRRGAAGWDELTRQLAAIPGALLLGSIREEDLFLLGGRSRAAEVRAEPDPGLAARIFYALKARRATGWAGWQEPWNRSGGLVLEYVHILSAGMRFEETLGEQVAARRGDPSRATELAALRTLALVGAAGATAEADRLPTALGASEGEVATGLARLIDEHLVLRGEGGRLGGLHQLRSAALVRLTHAVPPPTVGVTFARAAAAVSAPDIEPLVAVVLINCDVTVAVAIPALVGRLTREPDIDALSAMLRGLGTAYIARSVDRWLAMPSAAALPRTQVGTAVMCSLMAESLADLSEGLALATAAGNDLAAIRADVSADPRRALFDMLPGELIDQLVASTTDAATLDRFLAAQIGMPLHAGVRTALASTSVDLAGAPLEAVVGLLGTLAEIDRPLARQWVDAVGEAVLVSRIPAEVPWATPASFEVSPDGRIVRCDRHHIGLPDDDRTHDDVVRICETALALSPESDIAASAALAPNGEPAGFGGHNLAEKRIPRANLPTAALPAWNRRWRDAIALRVATPSYTEYLNRAAGLVEDLVGPLERVMELILRGKDVPDARCAPLRAITEGAQALTPPGVASADATGTGTAEFNPHVSKLQSVLFDASGDLVRRFHGLPDGAGAYIAWTGDLLERLDGAAADEPWSLIGGPPPPLARLRTTIAAARQIAGDVAGGTAPPAARFLTVVRSARHGNAMRAAATSVANASGAAQARVAAAIRSGLGEMGLDARVHVVDDLKAILPWPPSKALVLVPLTSFEQVGEFHLATVQARELCPELMRLTAIPLVNGVAAPSMGVSGYDTMLPLPDEAEGWISQLNLPSSPSRAWLALDRAAALASSLQSMDRLSLGVAGRPQVERDKREELESVLTASLAELNVITAPFDARLLDGAHALVAAIRSGEAGYADAAHAVSNGGEAAPILLHILGLRIELEQAELEALQTDA
jgi:hypothetical protein